MRLLPKQKRHAAFAFYQFCRAVDDAVDLAKDNGIAQIELAQWKKELAFCLGKKAPIARANSFAKPC
jgi:phytoene/squalene synthetase